MYIALPFPSHVVRFADVVGGSYVRFSLGLPDGAKICGIGFKIADQPLGQAVLDARGQTMHFAGSLTSDFYRGIRRIQKRLVDAATVLSQI